MKRQESPPPEHCSKPPRKWVYRGLILIAFGAAVLIGGFLLERPYVRALQEKVNGAHARNDVDNLSLALNQYAVEYGYHPEGTPADLLRTLRGENQRKIVFFECAARSVSSVGEFIDPWGQPYRIDQSDPSNPRVYSSGPNRLDEHGAKGSDDIVGAPRAAR